VLCSCKSNSKTESFNLASEDSFPASFIQDVQFINLDSTNPVSFIKSVELVDSSFYVLAHNGLFQYAYDGSFIRQISRQGRAEQEWLHLDTFFYSEKSRDLCLVDCGAAKIMHFSLDGTFLFSSGLLSLNRYYASQAVQTDFGILMASAVYKDNSIIYFLIPDEEQDTIIDLGAIPFTNDKAIQRIGTHPISFYQNKVKCIVPTRNDIREFCNGMLYDYAVIPTRYPLPGHNLLKEFEHSFSPFRMASVTSSNYLFSGYSGIFETERYLFLTSFNKYYTVVNKENNDCWVLSRCDFINKTGIPLDDCIGSSGNLIISILDKSLRQSYNFDKCIKDGCNVLFMQTLANHSNDPESNMLVVYTISQQ
jgi:hypothetical protein